MKPTHSQILFIGFWLLAGMSACQQPKSDSGLSGQFINFLKNKIEVTISDKTIQLKSSGLGGFSQCKPYFAWRNEGVEKWSEDMATTIEKTKISDKETKILCPIGPVDALITIRQLDDNIVEFSGSLKNKSSKTIEMARFHYLHGTIENRKANFIGNVPWSFNIIKKTDTLSSPRNTFEKTWKGMGPDWVQLSNPIHDEANWAVSADIGIFGESLDKPGWFFGFTGPGTAYGEVGYKTQVDPSPFFAGVLLENTILEPDSSRLLEKFIIYAGDWQDGMRYWVKRTAEEFSVKPQNKSLVGYCSWYQMYGKDTEESVRKANKEFALLPVPPGGRTVQIDAGWEKMAGDWTPDTKFEKIWKDLPGVIAASGTIPGLWIAPTAIKHDHPIIKEHPEMIQRLANGLIPVNFPGLGYFMEMDRPECRDYIQKFMTGKVAEGWRYFKVDFTYGLSTARVAWDRKKTSFQSFRSLYELLRKTCGPEVLINSCIGSIDRYPIGYVDIDRIGGDIGGNWNTVQGNLRDLLSRAGTNGYWWQADPDVFYMRRENSKLTDEENFLLTGSVYLIGGTFLTSDFPSQWSPEARKIIDSLWTKQGPRLPERHFVAYGDNNTIKAYLVSYNDGRKGPQHKVGIYNWSEKPETIQITLAELRFKPGLKWKAEPFIHNQSVKLQNNSITVENMPPHSLRIIDLYLE